MFDTPPRELRRRGVTPPSATIGYDNDGAYRPASRQSSGFAGPRADVAAYRTPKSSRVSYHGTIGRGAFGAIGSLCLMLVGAFASSSFGQTVTFQSFAEGRATTDVTTATVPTPAGTVAGDLLVLAAVTDQNTSTSLSPPGAEGWNLIARNVQGSAVTLGVWWKLATASEPASRAVTWSGNQQAYVWMMRFTGHDGTNPINASAVFGEGQVTSSPQSPSVTTTRAGTLILRMAGFDDDDITVDSPGLSGHTAITMDRSNTGTTGCSGGAGYVQQAAIGNSGTSNFTLTAVEDYRAVTIAIAPGCSSSAECDDGNTCTTDTCTSGNCTNTPVANGTVCDDNDPCSTGETCQTGVCTGTTAACGLVQTVGAWTTGLTHTVGPGADRLLVFMVGYENGADPGITAVFYGTRPLTRINGAVAGAGTVARIELWYLNEVGIAAASSNTFQVTYGGTTPTDQHFAAVSYVGVDQVSPIVGSAVSSANASTPNPLTATVGVSLGGMSIAAAACGNTGTYTWGNGWTEGVDQVAASSNSSSADHPVTTSGTDTASATHSSPNRQALVVASLRPAAGCTINADCDDGDQCTTDICNAGACENNVVANGTACDDGLFCTVGEVCTAGVCGGGAARDCSASGDQCNTGVCNETTDACEAQPVANGTACDDLLFCTVGEVCTAGVCGGGTARDCSASGDQCNTGVCNETTNVCEAQPVTNGTACDDLLFCTVGEVCTAGVCGGGAARDCSASGDQCNTGVCNETTDVCAAQPVANGTACDDLLFCTVGEVCTAGVCGGGTARDCSASGDQCNTGVCNETTKVCEAQPVTNGTACDDLLFCTVGDVCTAGVCGGSARDCSASGDQCNTGVCNETTDVCEAQPVTNGTACDDLLFCTVGDVCTAGVCGGSARDCSASGDQCNTGVCNETTDVCEAQPVTNGTACDDLLFCTVGEVCTAGACGGGTARDCSASGDQCNTGVCNETTNVCEAQPVTNGTACDDLLFCTVGEVCTAGVCGGGSARDCSASGDQCNTGVCNETTDVCEAQPVTNGTACDDLLFCTVGEVCTGGVCGGGTARDCSASGNQCNTGVCNETTNACEPQPVTNGTVCDDLLFCTVGDVCTAGVCGGPARDCSASGDQCNTGVCNETTDLCEAQPVTNGTGCDDLLFCTVGDVCTAGVCGGSARDCSASGDQCNTGVCNETTDVCEAQPVANGTTCDDALFCTVGEVCTAGACGGGSARNCSGAGDQCNTGVCNETTDACEAQPVTNGTPCDDLLFCVVGEVCTGGVCGGGSARDCSASGDQCNTGVCNETTDACEPQPATNGTACDDLLFCTVNDVCTAGACGGSARDCSASGNQCNTGVCNETTDVCEPQPVTNGTVCNDANACNVGETCQAGVCTGGAPPNCAGSGDQCNTASCDTLGPEGNCDTLTPVTNGTACNDANACNVGETCQAGVCTGGAPPNCSAAGDQCNVASCDPLGTDGNCDTLTPVLNGTACNDGSACNVGETCQAGVCTGGGPQNCSGAGDQCNAASCDPLGAEGNCSTLTPVVNGTVCNDGLFCTLTDSCTGGVCSGAGTPCPGQNCDETNDVCFDCFINADCDDGNTCTSDVCSAGACTNTATNEGLACNDGNACIVGETCQTGVCTGGAPPNCSASGDQCTVASCNPAGLEGNCDTITPVANGTACNDGNACNVGEACQVGVCTGGAPPNCAGAGDQCNTASCNPAGSEGNCATLTPVLNGTACDDGDACNVGETCQAGVCAGGAPPNCAPFDNQCNTASCNPAGAEGNCSILTPVTNGTACDDGLACNVGETCQAGVCTGGAAQDCSPFNDQCNIVSCEPAGTEGNCDILTPVTNGTPCDDGSACNIGETCQGGVCAGGGPPNCIPAGDQCNTASCNPAGAEGNCSILTPVTNGTACDDLLFCTVGDTCTAGVCGGSPRNCSASGDQCNTGVCNETTDACEPQPVTNGTPCDDSLFCTVGDACTGGVCGGAARDCSASGDQCNTGVCNETTDVCEPQPVTNGTACDDLLFCTVGDVCTAGVCGGSARDCSASGDQCNTGVCNETTDVCEPQPVTNGTACDDLLFCTVGDVCTAGVCGGTARDCSASGDQCNTGVCNETTDVCEPQPVTNGTACDDLLFCTVGDVCTGGVCGGTARDCSASGDQCNTGVCNETTDVCEPQPVTNGTACDDLLFCTVGDVCTGGVCGGTARDCSASGNQCNTGVCNETTDVCEPQPVTNGTACDDLLFCTVGDVCTSGVCGGTARDCSAAGDQCNTGLCNETTDVCAPQPIPNGTGCEDGLFCTVGDVCTAGVCGGTARDCSASGNQCNTGVCNETTDLCEAQPVANGTTCDDANACNVGEACQAGVCTGGAPPNCAPFGDQCNTASCNPAGTVGNCSTITPVADGTVCDDGVNCTNAVCAAGACVFSSNAGQVTVNLDVDALSTAVTRDVTFTITTCGSGTDTRVVAVPFAAAGTAAVILDNVDTTATFLATTEGHTLQRRGVLSFVACSATVDFNAASRLLSGDFQTATVPKDNLVDITDFSIMASRFNTPIAASSSLGADATGDGIQATADFTAIQANFLRLGDSADACVLGVTEGDGDGPDPLVRVGADGVVPAAPGDRAVSAVRTVIRVADLPVDGVGRADLNADGLIDASDIRAFAEKYGLPLRPEFERQLSTAEGAKKRVRSTR